MEQRIGFTTSRDGWRLAWSAIGTGPPVLYLLQKHHLTRSMEEPRYAAAIRRAATQHTVLRFDFRGSGLSQRRIDALSQAKMCDDIEAVLDAAGVERVGIVTTNNTCLWGVAFAVAHPERVTRLVLGSPMARWELAPALKESLFRLRQSDWLAYWETVVAIQLDSSPEEIKAAARLCAECFDPEDYEVLSNAWYASPIDHMLPDCRVPTLVVRRGGRRIHVGDDPEAEVISLLPNVQVLALDSVALALDCEWLTSDPVLAFLDEGTRGERRRPHPLSKREEEVLALVALGRTDGQIAEALTIQPATASRHVHNILEKLSMKRRSEAAAWWASTGNDRAHS